ncbi:hypothetical protein CDAR_622201 [Caerostris darwini]|uniref:Uncharacterized protein n=1 Tax=Caerostris darwini TaxID=1538125 RepID=A0AAV4QBJ2_9ARAC|nr:hypothetical protein CDAR_622201 [Caerostris darwini]
MDSNECSVIVAGQLFIRCLFAKLYKKFTNVGERNIEYDGEDLSALSTKLIFIAKDYITYFRSNALPIIYRFPITILTERERFMEFAYSVCKRLSNKPNWESKVERFFLNSVFLIDILHQFQYISCHRVVNAVPELMFQVFKDIKLQVNLNGGAGLSALQTYFDFVITNHPWRLSTMSDVLSLIGDATLEELEILKQSEQSNSTINNMMHVAAMSNMHRIMGQPPLLNDNVCAFCQCQCINNYWIFTRCPNIEKLTLMEKFLLRND